MKIRTLIVDDEPLARERIASMLSGEADVELLPECAGGPEAVERIAADRPDLLFLDVQMPRMNGLEVVRAVGPARMPVTIFVTAYDEHALAAFEVHALDYLLKPFKPARFQQALDRARMQLRKNEAAHLNHRLLSLVENARAPGQGLARIAVRSPDRVTFLRVEEIDWIDSAGNYLVLHSGGASHVLRETMARMESQLPTGRFVRISRSAIVQVDRIKELQPLAAGEYVVVLHNGKRLSMTRGLREMQDLLRFA